MKIVLISSFLILALNPVLTLAKGFDSGGADGLTKAEILFEYLMTSGFTVITANNKSVIQVSEAQCHTQKARWGSMAC